MTGAFTVTVTEAVVVLPAESVTPALMVWVPLLKVRAKLPPPPIWPSRLEVQFRFEVRFPSWESEAVPENVIVAPYEKVELVPGLLMATAGGLFTTGVEPIFATLTNPSG